MEKKVMTVMEVCECDGRCGQGYGELSEGNGCSFKIWLNNDFDK